MFVILKLDLSFMFALNGFSVFQCNMHLSNITNETKNCSVFICLFVVTEEDSLFISVFRLLYLYMFSNKKKKPGNGYLVKQDL